jgi:hypothetical protein
MAFTLSADETNLLKSVGVFPQLAYGSVALSNGTITVTIPNARLVKVATVSSQTANAARVSAVSSNTFDITGTGTDRVDWIAVVVSR